MKNMKPFRDLFHGVVAAFSDARVRGLLVFTMTLISGASVFYSWAEGWGAIDSIYFSVMTIATVGYGDLAPRTVHGKIFTIFYVLIGLGIFVAAATSVAETVLAERMRRQEKENRTANNGKDEKR